MTTPTPPSSFHLHPRFFPFHRLSHVAAGLVTLAAGAALHADTVVVINEIDADQVGTDSTEFIELYAYDSVSQLAVPNFLLDGYVVVLFNGNGDKSYSFTLDGVAATFKIDLTGKSTNAQGFFVIGSPGMAGVGFQLTNTGGWLQNGQDAVALYKNPTTDFSVATSVTSVDLVDAIVYDTADADDPELLAALTPGQPQVDENGLGTGVDVAIARIPDGGAPFDTTVYALQAPTPGSLNQPANALTLTLSPASFVEGATVSATVTRNGPTTNAATVTLTTSDDSEATVPLTVEIPAGSASAPVPITGADDLWPDGSQTALISATSPGYLPAPDLTVTVTDNGDTAQPLMINEVYATGRTDANGDGETNSGIANQANFNDEFVEIVNRSAGDFDLSGFTLFESFQPTARHTFPPGTVLKAGCALVVFGGGNASLALGITPAFGNAWIQKANAPTNGTYLIEPTDRLSLRNGTGQEVAGMTYDNQTGAIDSVTRDPDITGAFVSHSAVGGGTLTYSPGTKNDGTSFCTITDALTVSFAPASVVENAGAGATTLTVSRPAPFTNQVIVAVSSGDPTEAVPSAPTVTIPAGQASATLPIDAVNDTGLDGTQSVVFTCIGAGYLNGTASLEVTDDGQDVPPAGVFINEIDSDQVGTDTGEFIELYIGEAAVRALDGYIVVLFNGANANPGNGAYAVFDLGGKVTTAQGFFVLGNAAVPNVNMVFADNTLQNGADAVAVYRTAAANFQTTGTPTPPTNTDLVDVVVYGNAQADDADLLAAFQGGGGLPLLTQFSEGAGNNTEALARVPDATAAFGGYTAQAPTPGATNALSPLSGYDLWASGFPDLDGRTDDPDLDGFNNVAEYAVGGQPLTGAPSTAVTVSTSPSGKPRLTVSKGSIAAADPKLTYVVESSPDLTSGSWSTADTSVVSNTPTELVVDYSGAATTAFLRFKAVLVP